MTKKELLQRVEAVLTIMEQDPETNIHNMEIDGFSIKREDYYPYMYGYIKSSLNWILKDEKGE